MNYIFCESIRADGSIWRTYTFPLDTAAEAKSADHALDVIDYFRAAAIEEGVELHPTEPLRFTSRECESPEEYYREAGVFEYRDRDLAHPGLDGGARSRYDHVVIGPLSRSPGWRRAPGASPCGRDGGVVMDLKFSSPGEPPPRGA